MDEEIGEEAHGSGILLRTDYSDEAAWQTFLEKLHEGEMEFSSPTTPQSDEEEDEEDSQDEEMDDDPQPPTLSTIVDAAAQQGEDEEMEGGTESENRLGNVQLPPPIFRIINLPETSPLRQLFTSISNLGSLRLLNDVCIRHSPMPPHGTKRIKPPHRLIDKDGLQEIYRGKRIWIYDTRSTLDQSVRVVGQQSGIYGTAT